MGRRVTVSSILKLIHQRASASTNRTMPAQKLDAPKLFAATTVLLHVNSGDLESAISLLGDHAAPNPIPDSTYAALFRLCASRRALAEARRVHSHLLASHSQPPIFLLNRAIETYGKCGGISDARELFDEMPHRDGGTWNAMIVAYAQMGFSDEVIRLFTRMNLIGLRGNHVTFASTLGACGDLVALLLVLQIHGFAVKLGLCNGLILACSLVDSYGKCGRMYDSCFIFDNMLTRNSVVWNVIVRRYLEVGWMQEAIFMFFQAVREGILILNHTFSNAVKACTGILALEEGYQIHGIAIKIGFEGDNVLGASLIEMYAKCGLLDASRRFFNSNYSRDVTCWTSMLSSYALNGRMEEAEELFNVMPQRNVVSWNAMLTGFVQSLCWDKALNFVLRMQMDIEIVDHVTVSLIANICAGLSDLQKGKQLHGFAFRNGFTMVSAVGNSILDMYGKCGSLKAAEIWFNEMGLIRDTVSWNSLIRSFTCQKHGESALLAFRAMQREATPNHLTFRSILAACANLSSLKRGKQVHGHIIINGGMQDTMLSTSLINMYSKCHVLELAVKVFNAERSRDLFLLNSMILSCAYNGYGRDAINLFQKMEEEGIQVDGVTFLGLFRACITEGLVDFGQEYFKLMVEKFNVLPLVEHYDCMIDLFGKHGHLAELQQFIQIMPFEPNFYMRTRIFDYCSKFGNHCLQCQVAKHIS